VTRTTARSIPKFALLVLAVLGPYPGCKRDSADSKSESATPAPAGSGEVLLSGTFKRVAKKVEGRVELVRRGDSYALRLLNTKVDNLGEVHVYFVGLPDAKTTIEMAATETQYDFGPLEQGAPEQLIGLPSEPAPELRTVVLYEPRYRVNLASAALEAESTAK